MKSITSSEFRKNFDKYFLIGQKEEIEVTDKGKTIFTIIPRKKYLLDKWDKIFGILPAKAAYDDDIDRE